MKWYNDGKLQKLKGAMNEEKKKLLLEAISNFSKIMMWLNQEQYQLNLNEIQASVLFKIDSFRNYLPLNLEVPLQLSKSGKIYLKFKILNNQRLQESLKEYQIYFLEEDLRQLQNRQKMCIKRVIVKSYIVSGQFWLLHGLKQKSILILERYKQIAQINRNLQIYYKSILNSSFHISRACLNNIQVKQKIRKCPEQNVNELQQLLFALHRNLRTNDQGRLRNILRKFYLNRQKQTLLKKIQIQLLHTLVGQIEVSFQKWKALPENKELDSLKASVFEKSLNRFKIHMVRKDTFNQLQNIYLDGQARQKYTLNKMLYNYMSAQKKAFLKWYKIVEFHRATEAFNILDKKKLAIQLFYQHKMNQLNVALVEWKRLSSYLTNKRESAQVREIRLKREAILLFQNFGKIKLRIYFQRWNIRAVKKNMVSVFNAIQKLLLLNLKQDRELMKEALDIWKGPKLQNRWFQRVAEMIAKNKSITPQIAFWRMRDISTTSKSASLNSLQIVKCKKLINNLLKAYDRVRQRAFTNIEHFGRGITDTSSFQPSHSSFLQQTPVRDSLGKSQMESILLKNSQQLANQSDQELLKKVNELMEENSRLREQGTNEENTQSKDQQITEQQRLIQDLNTRLDRMRGQMIIKSLEEYQDHLVEDGCIAIKEQKRD